MTSTPPDPSPPAAAAGAAAHRADRSTDPPSPGSASRGLGAPKYWGLMHYRQAGAFGTEMALTGRFFTAEEAFEAGAINRVAPKGQHLEVARELAAEVCKNPPLSVRAPVRSRRWYMHRQSQEIMMHSAPLKLYLSEDFQEAASAFAEKRPPKPFKGR